MRIIRAQMNWPTTEYSSQILLKDFFNNIRRKRPFGHIRRYGFRFRRNLSAGRADGGGSAVEPAEKSLGSWVGWAHQHFGGRTVFGDLAAIHEEDMIGDVASKADLVGDDDHCRAVLGELTHYREHLSNELGVERRRDLVEQHNLGLHRQRSSDRDTLCLATRELVRVAVLLAGQPDFLEQRASEVRGGAAGYAFDRHRAFHHVLQRRHMREQFELLEDHADPRSVLGEPTALERTAAAAEGELLRSDADRARGRLLE